MFRPQPGPAAGERVSVPYEKLAPGPVGERIAVVDYDAARDCFYDPVDLDDPLVALRGGMDPSLEKMPDRVAERVGPALPPADGVCGRQRDATPLRDRPRASAAQSHAGRRVELSPLCLSPCPAGDERLGDGDRRARIRLFPGQRWSHGKDSGDLPAALSGRLAEEATRLAVSMYDLCVRALDYCPAAGLTFDDFLRACITADYERNPADGLGVRDALMQAFRLRGIRPAGAPFFSEDALRWPVIDPGQLTRPGPRLHGLPEPDERSRKLNQKVLQKFVRDNVKALSLRSESPFDLYPLQVVRRSTPDDRPRQVLVTQVVSRPAARRAGGQDADDGAAGGVTLIFDGGGQLRYAIRTGAEPPTGSATR